MIGELGSFHFWRIIELISDFNARQSVGHREQLLALAGVSNFVVAKNDHVTKFSGTKIVHTMLC